MQLYEIPAALRTPLDALDGEQDIQNDNEILNELQPQEKEHGFFSLFPLAFRKFP